MTLADRRPPNAEDLASMPSYTDYLRVDRGDPPPFFFERSTVDLGNDTVPVELFTSPEWHQREVDRLWKRTWQVACRENEIPNVGDQLAYDVVGQSVIVVRAGADEITAFHNACGHRATRLVENCVSAPDIQCSFHSWTWNLDGTLKRVPCRWDFPTLCDAGASLVEVKVARWNGLVFVNLDADAAPLESYLGAELRSQLERWPEQRSWKAGHVAKILPCNWKAALEAFIEVYHAFKVHPELMEYAADANSQYDFYGPHARMISAMGAPSPHRGEVEDQAVVDAMLGDAFANLLGADAPAGTALPQLAGGQTARQLLSDFMRSSLGQQTGLDYSGFSDCEVLDAIEYFVFPNSIIWGGHAFPMHYRVRPNGTDHRSCLWEVMMIVPVPDGAELPPDAPMRLTPTEEPWSACPELGLLGPILDQDMINLRKLQRGMESDAVSRLRLSNYQERNIRNFHQHLLALLESDKPTRADKLEIADLPSRYNHCLDKRKKDEFLALWAEDAVWDFGPPFGAAEGREAIERLYDIVLQIFPRTCHVAGNVLVDVGDGTATGTCDAYAWAEDANGKEHITMASYDDRYLLVDGAWRIARRTITLHTAPDFS